MRYLVALLLLVSAPVYAGGIPDLGDEKPVVQKLVAVARRDITRFKLNDTAFIPAETPAELSQEIIPFEDEQRVVTRANITALAEWCELDWKNASFLPFMDKERASHRWSEKQIAFIGGLHGITQGYMARAYADRSVCPNEVRERVKPLLEQ